MLLALAFAPVQACAHSQSPMHDTTAYAPGDDWDVCGARCEDGGRAAVLDRADELDRRLQGRVVATPLGTGA